MTDDVRHGETEADINSPSSPLVTLDVVSRRFVAAGLPRAMRTLQRYCMNGTLDCVKEATDTGDAYFVAEPSIERAIVSLRQLHDAKSGSRQTATERAMAGHDASTHAPSLRGDDDGHGPTPSDSSGEEHPDRQPAAGGVRTDHVAQLEHRLEEKDDEIAFLREELIDRRGQIKDMKGIIDGQNALLDTIQTNVAPIFKALASTVESKRIRLSSGLDDNDAGNSSAVRDGAEQWPDPSNQPENQRGAPGADEQRHL